MNEHLSENIRTYLGAVHKPKNPSPLARALMTEAADEIDRLRAELDRSQRAFLNMFGDWLVDRGWNDSEVTEGCDE